MRCNSVNRNAYRGKRMEESKRFVAKGMRGRAGKKAWKFEKRLEEGKKSELAR